MQIALVLEVDEMGEPVSPEEQFVLLGAAVARLHTQAATSGFMNLSTMTHHPLAQSAGLPGRQRKAHVRLTTIRD